MKHRILLNLTFAFFTLSLPLQAQKLIDSFDGYHMTLELDHPDHMYKVGEKVSATLQMTLDG